MTQSLDKEVFPQTGTQKPQLSLTSNPLGSLGCQKIALQNSMESHGMAEAGIKFALLQAHLCAAICIVYLLRLQGNRLRHGSLHQDTAPKSKPCPAGSQGTTKSFLLQAFAAVALQSLFVSGQEHCIHHHLSSVFIYVHQLSSAQPDQRCEHRSTRRRSEATLRCCSTASRYRDAAHCSGIRPTSCHDSISIV